MNKCNTLLVDDHPLLLEGLRSILSPYPDIRIIGSSSANAEALKLANEYKPDLVVMEVERSQDLNFVKQLRNIIPTAKLLIYTAHTDQRFLLELIQIGIMGHVVKSAPTSTLLQAIQEIRQGHVFLSTNDPGGHLIALMRKRMLKPHNEDLNTLSERENEIFILLAEGTPIRQIAQNLHLSPKTIESHKYNIFQKLHINSLSELIKIALRHGRIQI